MYCFARFLLEPLPFIIHVLLSFFYSEAQHEKTSFHIETSLRGTVWWNETQEESLCYTLVNSWSTGRIAFYAVTDISIVRLKMWLIWKGEFSLWQAVCMWKITGNMPGPAGRSQPKSHPGVNITMQYILVKLYLKYT